MPDTGRYRARNVVVEDTGWEYEADLWREDGQPIPVADFASLDLTTIVVLGYDGVSTVSTVLATPASILNTGRGRLVEAVNDHGQPVTRLTITFLPSDSAILVPNSEINLPASRERVLGERHLATIRGVYAGVRKYGREIEWNCRPHLPAVAPLPVDAAGTMEGRPDERGDYRDRTAGPPPPRLRRLGRVGQPLCR